MGGVDQVTVDGGVEWVQRVVTPGRAERNRGDAIVEAEGQQRGRQTGRRNGGRGRSHLC